MNNVTFTPLKEAVTPEQFENLQKLLTFLKSDVLEDANFNMFSFFKRDEFADVVYIHYPREAVDENICGSVACMVGWGPHAGVVPTESAGLDWNQYANRYFGANDLSSDDYPVWLWLWLFDPAWGALDNSLAGGIKRLEIIFEFGVPSFSETWLTKGNVGCIQMAVEAIRPGALPEYEQCAEHARWLYRNGAAGPARTYPLSDSA